MFSFINKARNIAFLNEVYFFHYFNMWDILKGHW